MTSACRTQKGCSSIFDTLPMNMRTSNGKNLRKRLWSIRRLVRAFRVGWRTQQLFWSSLLVDNMLYYYKVYKILNNHTRFWTSPAKYCIKCLLYCTPNSPPHYSQKYLIFAISSFVTLCAGSRIIWSPLVIPSKLAPPTIPITIKSFASARAWTSIANDRSLKSTKTLLLSLLKSNSTTQNHRHREHQTCKLNPENSDQLTVLEGVYLLSETV